jgi:hypothetical protein
LANRPSGQILLELLLEEGLREGHPYLSELFLSGQI